ncbi:MAG: hypothetical protein Q7S19_01150 [bacterium]|nr:hypothetical protein [bacterium]
MEKKYFRKLLFAIFLNIFFNILFLSSQASAASMSISPAQGTYVVGKTFTVSVVVSSADQAMNAVQGILLFPSEKLSVVGLSKNGSEVNLWVQDPVFDNSAGQVSFEGVVLNPGFIGSDGRILQVIFKVKAPGLASVSLTSASILANDGQGTNILAKLDKGGYLLEQQVSSPYFPTPEVKFIVIPVGGSVSDNPRPKLRFEVKNLKSPIDHYEVRADQGDFNIWSDDDAKEYTLPLLDPGKHTITARAFYDSNKFLESSIELNITPLDKPEITEYPRQLNYGENLIIKGKTYPNSTVTLHLQKDIDQPVDYSIKVDKSGEFAFVYDKQVSGGIYKFSVEVQDSRGAKSESTDKLPIAVNELAIIRIGTVVVNMLTLIISLLALSGILIFIMFYGWHKFRALRKELNKEIRESETGLHAVFRELKEDIEEQMEKLDHAHTKRELTHEEKAIRKVLLNHLSVAETYLESQIRDIDKKLFHIGRSKK